MSEPQQSEATREGERVLPPITTDEAIVAARRGTSLIGPSGSPEGTFNQASKILATPGRRHQW